MINVAIVGKLGMHKIASQKKRMIFAMQNTSCFDWRLKTTLHTFFVSICFFFLSIERECESKTLQKEEKKHTIWSLNSLHYYSHYINWMLLMFRFCCWLLWLWSQLMILFQWPRNQHTHTHTFTINRTQKRKK